MEPKTTSEPDRRTEQGTGNGAATGESGPEAAERGDAHPSAVHRVGEFVRRHPRLSLLTAAGVGVVAAPELAVGALIGAGAVMVASRRDRKRLVEEAESVRAESRGRTREMLDRAEVIGREVRTRARAVIQAARGKLAVEQEPSSGAGESGAGEEDWEEVRDEQPHPPASPAL